MHPYDTLAGKPLELQLAELDRSIDAMEVTVARARAWVTSQFSPRGPILRRRDIRLLYKTSWLLAKTGRSDELGALLDWIREHLLGTDGRLHDDLGEGYVNPVYQHAYIARAALIAGHPLGDDLAGFLGGLITETGAVRNGTGEPQETFSLVDAAIFGQYALAAGDAESARRAAEWAIGLVERQREAMSHGRFVFTADVEGAPTEEWPENDAFEHLIGYDRAVQPGWVVGLAMAFLSLFARSLSGPVSDAALQTSRELVRFETGMPVEAYYNLNKCKLAWGVGELLVTEAARPELDPGTLDAAYGIGNKVYSLTFLLSRLPSGAWTHDFYPLDTGAPEMLIDHRVFEGFSALPDAAWREDAGTNEPVPSIEVTAEHAAWTAHLRDGFVALRGAVRGRAVDFERLDGEVER